jgi:hypothetical protein
MQKLSLFTALTLTVLSVVACKGGNDNPAPPPPVVAQPTSSVDASKCPLLDGRYVNNSAEDGYKNFDIRSRIEGGIVIYTFDNEDGYSANGQPKVVQFEASANMPSETGTMTLTCPEDKTLRIDQTRGGVSTGFSQITMINDAGDIHLEENIPDSNVSLDYMRQ